MAEHACHELARSGFPVRPSQVKTLAGLLDPWDLPQPVPRPLLHAFIRQGLAAMETGRFAAVAEFRGFHSALADLFEEAPFQTLAGGECGSELAALAKFVGQALTDRGMALRDARLRAAAESIRRGEGAVPPSLIFDGFFTFAPAELELVEALAGRAQVMVTLPDSPGARTARERFASAGFAGEGLTAIRRSPKRAVFSAATAEREAEEIARRILDHAARGRRFREMGIVLRSREPYGPLLETTLARFGIPAHSYFFDPLDRHPAIAFLAGLVKACLEGWDHEALLTLMRMPVSGRGATPEGDRADFEARERLPGRGLPFAGLDSASVLETMRRDRLEPGAWMQRLSALRSLIPAPVIDGAADRDRSESWRSTAAALKAFDDALEQTAAALEPGRKLSLANFWSQAETVLALEPLRIPGNRRDVVHIMDAFEARQWELPVVFVPGMLERHFPAYHGEDPVLGETLRSKLGLTTAAQRNSEERFLFDLAASRATGELVLSYARFDEKGDKTLPSFFLEGIHAEPVRGRVHPAPVRAVDSAAPAAIQAPALLRDLAKRHRKLSASSIESFIQCPFQFFAAKTLRLRERPPAPRDRLDALVKGNIIHKALAAWAEAPLLESQVFHRVFEDECDRLRIPRTYRAEAVRLVLLRDFEAFTREGNLHLGWQTRAEVPFEFPATPQVTIRGRIDRLEIGPEKQALVIDYKYSAANKIRERVDASDSGDLVQAGVYLLAAEQALKLQPAGMLYCGVKKEIAWGGWHVPLPGLERVGGVETGESLRERMQATLIKIGETYEAIATGRVEVKPADTQKCRFCAFRDACRIETAQSAALSGGAS